jgi:hypothetical protein
MVEAYYGPDDNPSHDRPECRGTRGKNLIEYAYERVPTIDLADLLCGPAGHHSGLRRIGDKWVGSCPLPDCAPRLSSFAVWPGTHSWHCFNCMRGGGATELARLAGDATVAKARGW